LPPTVTLAPPAPLSNNTTPSFSGTATDSTPVSVKLYHGSSATGTPAWSTSTSVSGGSWVTSAVSPPLADGQYTVIAAQPSSLGNPEGKSAPASFTINTKAPTVTLAQPPTPSNTLTPSFSGTASEGTVVTVKVYEGERPEGPVVAEATATPAGEAWTSTAAKPALKSGLHTYTAVASQKSSLAGNPEGTSVPAVFTIDTLPPTVTLNPPAKPRSNIASPTFSGTSTDSSTVTVDVYESKKGVPVKLVTTATAIPAAGAWTSGPTLAPLADGEYTALATQPSSISGNPEGASAAIAFAIDTKPPAVTLTPLKAHINTPGPELSGGAGTEKGDVARVLVKIYKGTSVGPGAPIEAGEGTIVPSGKLWSFKSSNLADGTYTAQATQEDDAGNVGASAPVTFTIDTVAPAVTLNPPPERSNNRAPVFSGSGSELTPVAVAIYNEEGKEISKATAAGSGGGWTSSAASPELPKGKHAFTATATQTDEAGNTTTTKPVKFIVDTEAPTVTLNRPPARTNHRTPEFSGTASETTTPVVVKVYDALGTVVAEASAPGTGGTWRSPPVGPALPDGRYTVVATQASAFGNHEGETERVPFTVDTVAPHVTITSPGSGSSARGGSQAISGAAGTSEGDLPAITVQLYAGEGVGAPIQTVVVTESGGVWSATFAGLSPGTYTARAQQSDEAGNVGASSAVVFHLVDAAALAPAGRPVASFAWYPSAPRAGERVSLVSGSTDATSPLTGFAWDVTGSGTFQAGGQVLSTSFATPGNHVVRLRVTDAGGASNVAAEAIPVVARDPALMQPFPLVRIVSTRTSSGVKLRLLSILASSGARVTIVCKGHGCPVKRESRTASAPKVGLAAVSFARFQRLLRTGTTLEIRVYLPGEIGKYTRLSVRRSGLSRVDECLAPDGVKPMPCPSV
jgi:hypothetical protein